MNLHTKMDLTYIIIKRVDALNNIKVFWLCINRNASEDVNFIKKFKLF